MLCSPRSILDQGILTRQTICESLLQPLRSPRSTAGMTRYCGSSRLHQCASDGMRICTPYSPDIVPLIVVGLANLQEIFALQLPDAGDRRLAGMCWHVLGRSWMVNLGLGCQGRRMRCVVEQTQETSPGDTS